MSEYLQIPDSKNLLDFIPGNLELNAWQLYQYGVMQEQASNYRPYEHSAAALSGSIWRHDFHGKVLLRPSGKVYCCGLSYEHWFMCWQLWMQEKELSETGADLSFEQAKELYAYFFKFAEPDNKFQYGCADGIKQLGTWLDPKIGLTTCWHQDPYQAKFGAYTQLQSHADPMLGGHSAIFIGLFQHNDKDCALFFNANNDLDFGLPTGVKFSWFYLDKTNSEGFKRVFHFGEISPVEE